MEVVYEAKVSDELRQMALKLQLPPNFYSYLDAAPCPGCSGCEDDSEVSVSLSNNSSNYMQLSLLAVFLSVY